MVGVHLTSIALRALPMVSNFVKGIVKLESAFKMGVMYVGGRAV